MRKTFISCALIAIILLFAGCRTTEVTQDIPTHSVPSSPGVSNESELSSHVGNDVKGYSIAYGTVWAPSEENLTALFQIPENTEINEVSKTGHVIQTDDKVLAFDQGMISFICPQSEIVNSVLYIFRNNIAETNYNADQFSQTQDLKFASREEVIEALERLLQEMGKDEVYQITAYSLDSTTMEEQEKLLEEKIGEAQSEMPMVEVWDESCDSYYLQAVPTIDGSPLLSVTTGNAENGTLITNEMITAIYTRSGFELFMMTNGVDITSVEQKEGTLIESEQAEKIFDELNLSLLSNETYQVESMQLGYYSEYVNSEHTQVAFRPAWEAKTIATGEDASKNSENRGRYSYTISQYIDAETGQEIVEALG